MDGESAKKPRQAVTVSLHDLEQSSVPFSILEEAFGPSSLGILIVKDLPTTYLELRHRLLSHASYLANLPPDVLEAVTCPEAKYLSGWSHGKEALKAGTYDTFKGSYYVNCAFYKGKDLNNNPHPLAAQFPEFTHPNVWPAVTSLPGFRETFEELCTLIIDTAVLVARACDNYATTNVEDYEPGYLERVVKTSLTTKARLLHYFPHESHSNLNTHSEASEPYHDDWCATHIDHGCLTGLTSAIYIDEAGNPPNFHKSSSATSTPALPYLPGPPSPDTGLYIHARDFTVTKVSIPEDCLGFQTGEALQLITGGRFKAVPHFVRAGGNVPPGTKVARNTLAVFTQPNLEDVVDRRNGVTFGAFSSEVVSRFG